MVFFICKKKGYSYLDKFLTEQSHSIFMVFEKKILEKYEITVVHQLTTNNWM